MPPPIPAHGYRPFPLDGALLLFDRDTGVNILCEGAETAYLRQRAPRVVQFAITNRCNLACHFCSRDVEAASEWTPSEAFELLAGLAASGVLEVAFGGGEPWVFPGFADLVCRLHDETPLAVNMTTNGLALTVERLARIRGRYGQIRLSLYDDNDWRRRVALLADQGARFGVNYLVTPERLPTLEAVVLELVALGCRDILLLSYNGPDRAMHLTPVAARDLDQRVVVLARALRRGVEIKLDVCWGDRLQTVPRLLPRDDCGAGRDFLVVSSDRRVQPCSFHHVTMPAQSADEILGIWRERQTALSAASTIAGCARAPFYGLETPAHAPLLPLRRRAP